jgi:hypothetical protein
MHEAVSTLPTGRATTRPGSTLVALLIIVLLAGCTQTRDWLQGRRTATPDEPIILGAPEADAYLQELYRLSTGDAFTQVEIHADAESAATLTPDPSTRLRYALVLATPGHSASDPQAAQSLLRELLSQTEMMTPSEVALATLYLKDVEERLVLSSETRRLRAENAEAQTTEQQAISQRIARVEAENRRLRAELADAEQKLEAVTSIERSIRAQENDDN